METLTMLLQSAVSAGVIVAIVEGVKEAIAWKRNRKAQLEDRADESVHDIEELKHSVSELVESQKKIKEVVDELLVASRLNMLDRIQHLGLSYIAKGEVTYEQRRFLHEMHDSYHNGLHGNGDADLIMEAVDALPLKK